MPVSHTEKMVSALGGLIGILGALLISKVFVGEQAAAVIVASMGASAVLLFAVPHGPLSQPWALIGGHLISAVVGVLAARYVANELIAAGLAVGGAIGAMYYLRCIHPPGGATALSAVVGGQAVHNLGFQYVVTPILLNVLVIFSVAVLFNAMFKWRRYPYSWHIKSTKKQNVDADRTIGTDISHQDFVYALSEIDSFIDVSEHDLLRIYDLVIHKSHMDQIEPAQLVVDGYYSNGKYGEEWAVRHIVDKSDHEEPGEVVIVYRGVAGADRRKSGYISQKEFIRWAKYQVVLDEQNWKRVGANQQLH